MGERSKMLLGKGKIGKQQLAFTGKRRLESTMSKPKQDMKDERKNEWVVKTQKQKEVRGVNLFMWQSSVFLPQNTKGRGSEICFWLLLMLLFLSQSKNKLHLSKENYKLIYNYIVYANILGLLGAKISPEVYFFFNFFKPNLITFSIVLSKAV